MGQLVGLAKQSSAFAAAGFQLLALSADDLAGCARMRDATGNRLDVLSDPGAAFIGRLGLRTTDPQVEHHIALPATFIIDASGVVRYRYLSRSPDDRPKVALLLLAVERLADDASRTPRWG